VVSDDSDRIFDGNGHRTGVLVTSKVGLLTQEIVDLIRRTKDPNITVGKLFYTFSQLVPNTYLISFVHA
jgi:hypothetical protein